MRKPLLATLIVTSILCTCSCGVVGGEKLYTEEEFLAALESKYDADFEVVDSDKINNSEIVYTVIVEDDPDVEFEVKNYLMASSEVGPAVNRIECEALTYYFVSEYAYEGYMLYQSGDLESDYYILPKLYDSDSYDGKYTVSLTSEDKECIVTVSTGDDDVFEFTAGSESEFRGVCWDKDSYDLWLQYQDGVLLCYRMNDEEWKQDNEAEKPDYIVYNIHPNWE